MLSVGSVPNWLASKSWLAGILLKGSAHPQVKLAIPNPTRELWFVRVGNPFSGEKQIRYPTGRVCLFWTR